MNKQKSYSIQGYVRTDVGLVRQNNEDNFLIGNQWNRECCAHMEAEYIHEKDLQWNCFMVFDGIGGAERGELAAKFAAESAQETYLQLKSVKEYTQISEMMQRCFLDANNRIIVARNVIDVCGTTGTAFVTDGIMAKVFHVGDSRAYLYRNDTLFQLTKDQTIARLKLDAGFYTSLREATPGELHQLTEYMGRDETMQYFRCMESEWMDFRVGDKVLICSDGLYDQCSVSQMTSILKQNRTVKEMVHEMVSCSLEKGGQDNITCMILEKKELS